MFKKLLTPLLLCIILSACANNTRTLEPFSFDTFQSKKKGVVFLSVSEEVHNWIAGKLDASLLFNIMKIGEEAKLPYQIRPSMGWSTGNTNYSYNNMLYLDPGVYYIDSIYLTPLHKGSYIEHRTYEAPGLQDQIVYYGAFEVKAGEVQNLGKLLIPSFKLVDDTAVIKEQLTKSSYVSLVPQLTHGRFYEKGSIVYYNKRNQLEFVDSNTVEKMRKNITNEIIKKCK